MDLDVDTCLKYRFRSKCAMIKTLATFTEILSYPKNSILGTRKNKHII